MAVQHDGSCSPLCDLMGEAGILINGTFQNPAEPLIFITEDEAGCLQSGCLVIDVSCDEGMGFFFAKPSSFQFPILRVGEVDYYTVEHTPSYLWESASRSLSAALLVYLAAMIEGRRGWENNETLRRAVNIDRGVILKPDIISFQSRQADDPHVLRGNRAA
jgi:N5-(carboxyethyl)ornithine synthase